MESFTQLNQKEDYLSYSGNPLKKEEFNKLILETKENDTSTISLRFNPKRWESLSLLLKKNSSLTLSLFWSEATADQIFDIVLEEGAYLDLQELELNKGTITRKGTILLGSNSKIERLVLNLSTGSRHIVWNCNLIGEGAEFIDKEAHFGTNKSITKNVITILHKANNTKSNVTIKTALKDASTNFAHGIVRVEKDVIDANTFFSTQALLLDKNATAQAIPALEIESSEVQAGHAASVSTINEDHLFYLTTRGLSETEAKRTITNAFLAEIFNSEEINTLIDHQWQ
ncbi:MAG: SufD family Fe-S cluster assembly protein [Candidatus Nanoarchaeia archaeon]